jgi:7,8-dihydropterin-6-yl-methyl-4-(beta-D-ribofuranosyl)aminobenzene 5'-phosphate synthase
MLMKTLVEDTALSGEISSEHGLSLYIEANGRRLLFDMGKTDLFLENAAKLGVRIDRVDLAVVSHGHYDHGGGLSAFLNANRNAMVYIRKQAFERHLALRADGRLGDIGIDLAFLQSGRLIYTGEYERVSSGIELFSDVTARVLYSDSNQVLLTERGGKIVQDDFVHEQNLILNENGKCVLVAGCAHCGIVNIVRKAQEIAGRRIDVVIGGFHLHNPTSHKTEQKEKIVKIGEALRETGSLYYTGHCTGPEPFAILKEIMGDRLEALSAGSIIEI